MTKISKVNYAMRYPKKPVFSQAILMQLISASEIYTAFFTIYSKFMITLPDEAKLKNICFLGKEIKTTMWMSTLS